MRAPAHRSRVLASPWAGVHASEVASGRHYGRHWHATFGFGLLDSGAQRSASGRGTVDAYAGHVLTHNPGEVHDGRPLDGPSRRWRMVYLEPEMLTALAGGGAGVELTRPVIADAPLQRALRLLLRRLEAWNASPRTAGDALACEEALVDTCGVLLERHATATAGSEPVDAPMAAARERLADDLLSPPSLGELAALVGIGRFQLLRRFAQAYGVTPYAWLQQQRVEQARGLIRHGMPLAQAAAQCGFADQSHLTRLFTRQLGFTPGAWQRACARTLQ